LNYQIVQSQQHLLYYKLVKANDSVGEMTVAENRSDVLRTIKTTTKALVPTLLIDISMEDIKYSEFQNQVLQSATVTRKFFNGKPQQSKTIKTGEIYTDGYRPLPLLNGTNEISYTSTMLYTTEPLNNTRIYSEYHHQFMSVQRMADHVYSIRFPDGQICKYFYEKGICVRIVTQTTWATIESILISQNLALK
jgi:hypothetical protein